MNWLFWLTDAWVQFLDGAQQISNTAPAQASSILLINGGMWSYTASGTTLAWSAAFNLAVPGIPDADNQVASGSVTLPSGSVCYVNANIPFSTTGNTSNGSNQLTALASTNGIANGQTITGANIPGGTTVSSIAGTTVTMSANATGSATGSVIVFAGTGALTAQVATESSLVLAPNTVIIGRGVTLPSGLTAAIVGTGGASTILRDGDSVLLRCMGFVNVTVLTAGENLTKGQAAYISPGSADGGRSANNLYRADASAANGAIRSQWAGIVTTTVSSGSQCAIVTNGTAALFTGLTVGLVYLDPTTLGGVTNTKPTTVNQYLAPVGIATSSSVVNLNPSMGCDSQLVTSLNPWPQYGVASESHLDAALSLIGSAGGGVIVLTGPFTVVGLVLLPANTKIIGRGMSAVVTLQGASAIIDVGGDNCLVENVAFVNTDGLVPVLVGINGLRCDINECTFQVPATSSCTCLSFGVPQGRSLYNSFFGVLGSSTATGIAFGGTECRDADSSFTV